MALSGGRLVVHVPIAAAFSLSAPLTELPGVTASGPGLVPGSPSQRFPYKAVGTGSGPREQIPGTRPYTWVIFWPHGNEDPTAGVPVVVATPDVL